MTSLELRSGRSAAVGGRTAGMTASSGRIYFWQGGSLWIGEGRGRTQWHAHHAHQIALAPQGQFRFRTESDGAWTAFEAALVPGHRTHQFELDGIAIAHLFVEPESRAGRVLAARFGSDEVAALPASETRPLARALFAASTAGASRQSMVQAARQTLMALCGSSTEADGAMDPRLARALAVAFEAPATASTAGSPLLGSTAPSRGEDGRWRWTLPAKSTSIAAIAKP